MSVIVFSFLGFFITAFTIASYLRKASQKSKSTWTSFLKEEHEAQFITKKDFPMHLVLTCDTHPIPSTSTPACQELYEELLTFNQKPMANLTHYTNLQLKTLYGMNHFYTLVAYEDCLLRYIACLKRYLQLLNDYHHTEEAQQLATYMNQNNLL